MTDTYFRTIALVGACFLGLSSRAYANDYSFEWIGANDYRIEGAFRTDGSPSETGLMSIKNILCFRIIGFKGTDTIGEWRLGSLTDDMAWHFNFEPETGRLPIGGWYRSTSDQQWNSAASYNYCGQGEFGFNAGSGGQELCLNGRLIYDSMVDGDTPLFANEDENVQFDEEDCGALFMS